MAQSVQCLEHSGVLSQLNTLTKEIDEIKAVEIKEIKDAINELRIFIAKIGGGLLVIGIILDKIILK